MKRIIVYTLIAVMCCGLASAGGLTNIVQTNRWPKTKTWMRDHARMLQRTLIARWIHSDKYPAHDEKTGLGQMTAVQYRGTNALKRTTGFIVTRIITDKSGGPRHGQKWCLVEFGDGYPWVSVSLTNLTPIAASRALDNFPSNGVATWKMMLGED